MNRLVYDTNDSGGGQKPVKLWHLKTNSRERRFESAGDEGGTGGSLPVSRSLPLWYARIDDIMI